MLVIGDREVAEGTVSVRSRSAGDLGARPAEDFVNAARREVDDKSLKAAGARGEAA
jgi:threonyl-tRNA synthetase